MDTVSTFVAYLAYGFKVLASNRSVKAQDACLMLIELVRQRYPKVSLDSLERDSGSKINQAKLEADLLEANANNDIELIAAIDNMINVLQSESLIADIEDSKVKSIDDMISEIRVGSGVGVRIKDATVAGEITFGNIMVGSVNSKGSSNLVDADADYTIGYATNRAPVDTQNPSGGYSSRRDTTTHYGECRVFVPKSHKIGSTGSSLLRRLLSGEDDRLRLRTIQEMSQKLFWQSFADRVNEVDKTLRQGVVFIHGYNVSFEQAAVRAAQIGFDLSIPASMAFFSWPSQGTMGGYLADAASIDASEDAITDFLIDFSERSGVHTTHIIAHSMGNRGVLRAVERIARRTQKRTTKRFGQVILAAADVDADVFRQRCGAYGRVAQRATLYVSTRDFAVEASRWLHNFPRAGLMPPVLVAPGIDTINVTNVDLTQLGHGYIAEARDVLADIHGLIHRDTPPEHRFGLRAMDGGEGSSRFWVIGA